MKRLLIPLALGLAAFPALADIQNNGKTIDCYCTDSTGGRVDLGEKICLHVDGKMFTAQCQMSLNVPMWRKVEDGCTTSQLLEPRLQSVPVDAHITPSKS
ncbi:hypothetical protein RXV86_04065 [Alisedimentitalea sp. MJ-SS2]|uniref:hypothetical protein n=1 Tax=Aliisedimentitalea sp. MJ-SS2 TaxID=3049795 RepID=UPI00291569B3|nr:hypothetical protein [Alisedimentitalea sp. MJ-SS2]MDU8926554.1 hypothetical protein [Alisedimentitalea sp. MJ-SS2]